MSDTTPPAQPEPTPPSDGYTAQPAANPYASGAAPAKAPVLSIISLIAGIVGFLGAWIVAIPIIGSILGLFIPAAAVILGVLGKKKEPQASKGLWLTGIILGAVSLAIAVIALIFWIIAIAGAGASGVFDYSY
ncbi:MAG: hypothetical protein WED09_11285 [Homoserinimonas sp.]